MYTYPANLKKKRSFTELNSLTCYHVLKTYFFMDITQSNNHTQKIVVNKIVIHIKGDNMRVKKINIKVLFVVPLVETCYHVNLKN